MLILAGLVTTGIIGLIGVRKLYRYYNSRDPGYTEGERVNDENVETPNSQEDLLPDANLNWKHDVQHGVESAKEMSEMPAVDSNQNCSSILAELDFDENPSFLKTIRTKAAKKDSKAIFGLTVLNGELFIISQHSQDIEVYDSQSLDFKHKIHLGVLYDPIDIKSCLKNNCMYISDWQRQESGEIIRIDSGGKLITKWNAGVGGGYISVTPEASVLLSVWDKSQLIEFTADGKVIREIALPSSIRDMRLAIKLPDGGFLISQGEDEESEHSVSLVDDKGVVLKSIGGKQGSLNGEFYGPNYMAVDGSGFVLVADQNNSRVVLLSPDLEFKKEVIQERDGLRYPVRIHLDQTSGRLFVADNDYLEGQKGWRDGMVRAFEFRIRHSS